MNSKLAQRPATAPVIDEEVEPAVERLLYKLEDKGPEALDDRDCAYAASLIRAASVPAATPAPEQPAAPRSIRAALEQLLDECDMDDSADGQWFEHWVAVLEALAAQRPATAPVTDEEAHEGLRKLHDIDDDAAFVFSPYAVARARAALEAFAAKRAAPVVGRFELTAEERDALKNVRSGQFSNTDVYGLAGALDRALAALLASRMPNAYAWTPYGTARAISRIAGQKTPAWTAFQARCVELGLIAQEVAAKIRGGQ